MCENIKVETSAEDYEAAVIQAMILVKNILPEEIHVFRDPEECSNSQDWYLHHTECVLSSGHTQVGGMFLFRRNYEGDEPE